MKRAPSITEFVPNEPYTAEVSWADGTNSKVDLTHFFSTMKVFKPLLHDPMRFNTFRLEDGGYSLSWSEDMSIAAPTLWRLSMEQAGEIMSWQDFLEWRKSHDLTQEAAARELGLTRRRIADYESGLALIPKTVLLATRGYDVARTADELKQQVPAINKLFEVVAKPQMEDVNVAMENIQRYVEFTGTNFWVIDESEVSRENAALPKNLQTMRALSLWYSLETKAETLLKEAFRRTTSPHAKARKPKNDKFAALAHIYLTANANQSSGQ